VGSTKEKGKSSGHYYVSEFLGIGRDGFADVAAAIASRVAAGRCERVVKAYNTARYGRPMFTFSVPPGLRELVKGHRRLGRHRISVDVPVHELVAAKAPGAEHCYRWCSANRVERCGVELHFVLHEKCSYPFSSRNACIDLVLFFADYRLKEAIPGYLSFCLSLSAGVVGDSKIGVSALRFPMSIDEVAYTVGRMRKSFGVREVSVTPLLDLMVWLARRLGRRWRGNVARAAAGLAAALLPAAAAAFHEIQRASRICVSGLEYPAVEEAAEEARMEALEVYSRIAEHVATSGDLFLPKWAEKIRIKDYTNVWGVMWDATRTDHNEDPAARLRADAERALNSAAAEATATRAAAEILASLSEPE